MSLIRKEDLIAEYDRVHQDRNEIERLESVEESLIKIIS